MDLTQPSGRILKFFLEMPFCFFFFLCGRKGKRARKKAHLWWTSHIAKEVKCAIIIYALNGNFFCGRLRKLK